MPEVTLDAAPRKARELFDKGFAAMERGNLDYAMDMFTSALDIEPRLLRARKFLRAAQIKKQGKGNPIKHLVSAVAGLGGIIGTGSAISKKPEEAVKKAEKLLRTDPLNLTFIKLFDKAATAADLPEAAVLNMEIANEHHPNNADIIERLGQRYQELEDTEKARQCFEKLVAMRPKDQRAIKLLKDASAIDTMRSGGWDAAGTYRDVMKDQKEAVLLEQEAKAVKADTSVEALIKDTQEKIEHDPENLNYKRALADLYTRAGRFNDASDVLQQALAASGGGDPEIERAIVNTRLKEYDHRVAELAESGDDAAVEAVKSEKQDFMFQTAQERVAKYPNDLQLKYELGVLLYERDMLNEAIQQFQASQRNPQRRTLSLYHLALCFESKQQHDIAAEQLHKALADLQVMDDMKKSILYELGQVSEAMGNNEKAVEYYKEIYAVDIGYRDVASKIEQDYDA